MGRNGRKRRKKTGRPKAGEGVTKKMAKVMAIKHDGSPAAMAQELGISPEAAAKHLQKKDIKRAVLSARNRAIKRAGLTRLRAYKQLSNQLSAKVAGEIIIRGKIKPAMIANFQMQDQARKDYLKIIGDYQDDTPTDDEGKVIPFLVLLPMRVPEKIPKIPKEDVTDV